MVSQLHFFHKFTYKNPQEYISLGWSQKVKDYIFLFFLGAILTLKWYIDFEIIVNTPRTVRTTNQPTSISVLKYTAPTALCWSPTISSLS